jgi:hypothetical protein
MQQEPQEQSFWRSPVGIVCLGFLVVGGFFLMMEHTAHIFGVLPWLLILACPLMHLFMHRGHGHSGGADHKSENKK